jgi:uncharacterized protein YyaL (SSP411 family)
MSNRLAHETSPYLRQHAHNPVDWYPWGPEALERARAEERPILLSIGYAACHWCHVMERESFEDEGTARLMNEHFVNIKVDREERPDLDGIYMQAVQAMTGHGGWPMTVFLTPEGVPFYGGTYYPPEDRSGMPSFRRVLLAIADAWRTRRADLERTVASMRELYAAGAGVGSAPTAALAPPLLERAYRGLAQRFDLQHGGFEGAPKFPQAMALDFLLRYWRRSGERWALDMVAQSFRHMARGGIYDQVGGGFHRYTVDAIWLVPHFEKMLYDNALLARLGVHLWQGTRDEEARRVAEETLDWAAREMTSPAGGFYSSLDADSEGHEGKFYVWTPDELDALLGPDAEVAKAYWGVTTGGNFEGTSILYVPVEPAVVARRAGISEDAVADVIARARRVLYDVRAKRVWPGRDDKVLAGWNGLMLRAFAEAARAFGRDDYRARALESGEFLFAEMVREGRVMRSHKDGVTRIPGFLEDHGAVGLGALALYELTFDRRWLDRARAVAAATVRWFWDDAAGAFFDTASDHEQLVTRPREVTDNAVPAGNSLAVELLWRLGELTADAEPRRQATRVLEALAEPMARYPIAFGHLLGVADLAVHGAVELAIVGEPASAAFAELARVAAERYIPSLVLAGGPEAAGGGIALLEGRTAHGGEATAYVCRNYACEEPVTNAEALGTQLDAAAGVLATT